MPTNNTIQNRATQSATAIANKEQKRTIQDLVQKMSGEIKKALPSVITPERFTRIVLSALSTNPKLAECTPESFLGAMMTAAQLGVEPNTPIGQAYLIPRYNKNISGMECQFQLGYKGLIDLAYRSGEISTIYAHTVYSNDDFEIEYGLHEDMKHVPAKGDRGYPVGYYAVYHTKDGGYGFAYMTKDEIDAHAKQFSDAVKNGKFSPWSTNYDEMAKKTVLKKALKYAPVKTDFVRGIASDETVKSKIGEDMSIIPDESIQSEFVDDAQTAQTAQEAPVTQE